jgi:effector-binding domain-containing protein
MGRSLIYIKINAMKTNSIASPETIVSIKEIKPINFLYFRVETRVDELYKFIAVAKDLFREAVSKDLHVTGPVHWHYFGFSDTTQPFTLEISLPVDRVIADYDGMFHFKRTEPFKCVSLIHEGGWLEIPNSYQKAFQFIDEHGLTPIGANRELYINADFADPGSNTTEIQIGVK